MWPLKLCSELHMTKPLYNRVLLKLSGEALAGSNGTGLDSEVIQSFVKQIISVVKSGVQVGIVIGGGNFIRGANLGGLTSRVTADHMGMLATVTNGLALRDTFLHFGQPCTLMSPFGMDAICENYNHQLAKDALAAGKVVIFSGGTGNPFCTTDSAAVLRAIETYCDVVLKATNVDGIYTADPRKDPNATRYIELTYDETIEKKLKVMDIGAFVLAQDHKMPIRVFNINKEGELAKVITDHTCGTLVK